MTETEFEKRENELLCLLGVGSEERAVIVAGNVGVTVSLGVVPEESAAIVAELNKLRLARFEGTESLCIGRLTYLGKNK